MKGGDWLCDGGVTALGAGGTAEPKPVGRGRRGGPPEGALPPASPPDPISMLSCSCSQQELQTAGLRSLGRYQQLLTMARAVPVPGQHVP